MSRPSKCKAVGIYNNGKPRANNTCAMWSEKPDGDLLTTMRPPTIARACWKPTTSAVRMPSH